MNSKGKTQYFLFHRSFLLSLVPYRSMFHCTECLEEYTLLRIMLESMSKPTQLCSIQSIYYIRMIHCNHMTRFYQLAYCLFLQKHHYLNRYSLKYCLGLSLTAFNTTCQKDRKLEPRNLIYILKLKLIHNIKLLNFGLNILPCPLTYYLSLLIISYGIKPQT